MKSKNKFLIILCIITLIRFLISFNLPSLYISNLIYNGHTNDKYIKWSILRCL